MTDWNESYKERALTKLYPECPASYYARWLGASVETEVRRA